LEMKYSMLVEWRHCSTHLLIWRYNQFAARACRSICYPKGPAIADHRRQVSGVAQEKVRKRERLKLEV
jgi:hypothetical protein